MHSMMIATEPLPEAAWKEIGLASRETFGSSVEARTRAPENVGGRFETRPYFNDFSRQLAKNV